MKGEILKLLKESDGYLSGQELCERFGVSRTAVWKVINQLKEEGYEIEAIRNKGYILKSVSDVLSKEELENKIATLTGGRAAEEFMFHSITTGASNDIEQATKLARAMLTRYGMSDEFDMVALETVNNQYLGGDTSLACSAQTQCEIDQKVVELVKAQHAKAVQILTDNRAKLDELAQYLYQKETITGDEFMEILNREG